MNNGKSIHTTEAKVYPCFPGKGPGFYILGRLANMFIIRRRLNEIFEFRRKVLEEWAGSLHHN